MASFLIRCTTCKTALKVRDPRLAGQIVPCPKCGGMVLVERPAGGPAESGQSATGSVSRVAPSASAASAPLPPTDSFDHIDRLLDEPPPMPAKPSWATAPARPRRRAAAAGPAAASDAASEPGAAERASSGAAPKVPQSAASEAQAVETSTTTAATSLPGEGMDETSAPEATLRFGLMVGGGAIVGAVMATGLAVWLFAQSAARIEPAAVRAPVPESNPSRTGTPAYHNAAEAAAAPSSGSTTAAGHNTAEDPVSPSSTPPAETAIAASQTSRDAPPSPRPAPPDPASVQQERTAEPGPNASAAADAGPSGSAPKPPTSGETPPSPNRPPTDDLAAFALWLQDSDSTLVTAPPLAPGPPAPPAEVDAPAAAEPVVLQPTRPEPPIVDVAARLSEPISAIQLQDIPLVEALQLVTQLSTIPIHLAPDAICRRNMRANHSIRLTARDVTVRQLLDQIAAGANLGWTAVDGYVMVTTVPEASGELVTFHHDVADLIGGNADAAAALSGWVTQLIEYGSWSSQADPGAEGADVPRADCRVDGTKLVVTQRDTVQYRVLEFLEKLRVARGLAPRTRILSDRIAMGPRATHCVALEQTISLRPWQEQTIGQLAMALGRQASLQILIDWPALHAAGWSPEDTERFFCEQQALEAALDAWLRTKGLTYRVIDAQTLEITTPQALAGTHDVEMYRLKADDGSTVDLKSVTQQLLNQLGEATFQPEGSGALAYDELSGTLIVSLPQPDQAVVARIIASLRPAGR